MNQKTQSKIQSIITPIYDKYKDRLYTKQLIAPDIRQMAVDQANDMSLPEYQRQRHQNLLDAGVFDETEDVLDGAVAEAYENEVGEAIKAAIEAGELPKPRSPRGYKKLLDKSKQNAKRKQVSGKPVK